MSEKQTEPLVVRTLVHSKLALHSSSLTFSRSS
jgi:hypothetical protein